MRFFTNKKITQERYTSGFAMLFAVLASSLLIAIGISIFNISLKELQIATSEQASQAAYYAADSAEECALYWDIKKGAFPTCLNSDCSIQSTSTNNTIACNGNAITFNFSPYARDAGGILTYATNTINFFRYSPTGITSPIADMIITKQFIPGTSGNPDLIRTIITTEGHNSGIIGRRVERGIIEVHNQ